MKALWPGGAEGRRDRKSRRLTFYRVSIGRCRNQSITSPGQRRRGFARTSASRTKESADCIGWKPAGDGRVGEGQKGKVVKKRTGKSRSAGIPRKKMCSGGVNRLQFMRVCIIIVLSIKNSRRPFYDQDDSETCREKSHRLRRMQKHLPVRLQDQLHGRQSVLRENHARRENRAQISRTFREYGRTKTGVTGRGFPLRRFSAFVYVGKERRAARRSKAERS